MFENYHLVHFEVANRNNPASSHTVTAQELNSGAWGSSQSSELLRKTSYRISGSFDYLLPSIRASAPEEFADSQLFLQSFCVMDNGTDSFTRREGYASLLLSYTYAGEGALRYEGKEYVLTPGTGFVIDCRNPHEYHCTGDHWQHADLHLWGVQAEALYACFQELDLVLFERSPTSLNRHLEEVLDAYTNHLTLRNLYVGNALSTLLCSVLKQGEQAGVSGVPGVYRQMLRHLEENYMHPLSLDDLSEQFHVSKYHLSREFHRYTGYAPGEYLIRLRIQHASILLAQSDLSVGEIALQSGFPNLSNFIGQMKKRTGMTPSAFRKMCKDSI